MLGCFGQESILIDLRKEKTDECSLHQDVSYINGLHQEPRSILTNLIS